MDITSSTKAQQIYQAKQIALGQGLSSVSAIPNQSQNGQDFMQLMTNRPPPPRPMNDFFGGASAKDDLMTSLMGALDIDLDNIRNQQGGLDAPSLSQILREKGQELGLNQADTNQQDVENQIINAFAGIFGNDNVKEISDKSGNLDFNALVQFLEDYEAQKQDNPFFDLYNTQSSIGLGAFQANGNAQGEPAPLTSPIDSNLGAGTMAALIELMAVNTDVNSRDEKPAQSGLNSNQDTENEQGETAFAPANHAPILLG